MLVENPFGWPHLVRGLLGLRRVALAVRRLVQVELLVAGTSGGRIVVARSTTGERPP
jgi:hypothetical protein